MKYLYKTSDVVKFLVNYNCELTAESVKDRAGAAEFLDSELVREELIPEIYVYLEFELNRYSYKK